MPLPRKMSSGAWKARKRIPGDIRDEYARAYDVKREATKTWPAGTKETTVKREHAEWLAEIEGRIEALRSARNGTGISLSKKGAAALAAQWYDWFTEKDADEGAYAEHAREEVRDAFIDAADEGDLRHRKEVQIWAEDEGA